MKDLAPLSVDYWVWGFPLSAWQIAAHKRIRFLCKGHRWGLSETWYLGKAIRREFSIHTNSQYNLYN